MEALLTDNTLNYEISFRIKHPSIDPKEISNVLNIDPVRCWKAGEPRTTQSAQF